MTKTPEYLSIGDQIALVAPSFGCTTEPYSIELGMAIEHLKEEGFEVKEGKNIWKSRGFVASNTPKQRALEFIDAYFDEDSKLILSVGGGETMVDILPYIDFKKIALAKPKWFMGFSDNTNLTFTLTTLCGVKTIYGPCAPALAFHPFVYNVEDAFRMLFGEKKFKGYPKYEKVHDENPDLPLAHLDMNGRKKIIAENYTGPFSGTLLGGCLDCIEGLIGTPYDNVKEFVSKQKDGVIWFLEACDLNALDIYRALNHMDQAGWLKNAKGFLFGRHLCKDDEFLGCNKYTGPSKLLGKRGIPLLYDVDLGHIPPSLPFMNGAHAEIKMRGYNIHIAYDED